MQPYSLKLGLALSINNFKEGILILKQILRNNIWLSFLLLFIVGNISFYLAERVRWVNDEHLYPKAKEWLVPANMMLVYGTTLTKLPFVDERSFIMIPIIKLQDYFVSKWEENLPDDDAEKYLGWYTFKLRTYIVPNANSVVLYNENTYSFDETRTANDEAWKTIEAMVQYKSKDKEFNEIRYTAFLTLSHLYKTNVSAYWYDGSTFHKKQMFADREKMQRFYKLYEYLISMDNFYKTHYPNIFEKLNDTYYKNHVNFEVTDYILLDLLNQKKEIVCSSKYYKSHFKAKTNLITIHKSENLLGKDSIDSLFKRSNDKQLEKICKKNEK